MASTSTEKWVRQLDLWDFYRPSITWEKLTLKAQVSTTFLNFKEKNMLFSKPKWVEKWPRSFSKVISWRVTVTLSNFLGAWWTSGSMAAGLGFAGFALVVNSALYFVHERAWNRVSWAKDIASETEPVESAK